MRELQYENKILQLKLETKNSISTRLYLTCNGLTFEKYLEGEDQLDWLMEHKPAIFTEFLQSAADRQKGGVEVMPLTGLTKEIQQKSADLQRTTNREYLRLNPDGSSMPLEMQF